MLYPRANAGLGTTKLMGGSNRKFDGDDDMKNVHEGPASESNLLQPMGDAPFFFNFFGTLHIHE
jgi:hypothetical protein